MKTSIQTTVLPPVPAKGFNDWQKNIQKHIDKIVGTNVAKKLKS